MKHVAMEIFDDSLNVMYWDRKAKRWAYHEIELEVGTVLDGRLADAKAFAQAVKDLGITGGRTAISLKTPDCVLRSTSFPGLSEKELAGAIRYSAASLFPFSLEDYILDYAYAKSGDIGWRVTVVAIPQDLAEGYTDVLVKLGIRPERLTIFQEAMAVSLHKEGRAGALLVTETGDKINIAMLESGIIWEAGDIRPSVTDYVTAVRPFIRISTGEMVSGAYIACGGSEQIASLTSYLEAQSIPVYAYGENELWKMSLRGVYCG